jgi:hypothetical protein
VLSAPVLDEDGEYSGCLSVNDLLKSLYKGERGACWAGGSGCRTDTELGQRFWLRPVFCLAPRRHGRRDASAMQLQHTHNTHTAVLAEKDPEWFEKIESLTPADLVTVGTTFAKQTVDKVQHGEWCG